MSDVHDICLTVLFHNLHTLANDWHNDMYDICEQITSNNSEGIVSIYNILYNILHYHIIISRDDVLVCVINRLP